MGPLSMLDLWHFNQGEDMSKLRSMMLVLLAFVTLSTSFPTQAGIGKLTKSRTTMTVGASIAATAGVGTVLVRSASCDGFSCLGIAVWVAMGIAVTTIGLVILEEEGSLEFRALSAPDAKKLKITEEERLSFNAELDQINALADYVDLELEKLDSEDPYVAADIWNEVKDVLSPASFSALGKVSSQILR